MALGRKAAVGTALDKEELEQLLDRLTTKIEELKTTTWELSQTIVKANRAAEDLKIAAGKAEGAARKRGRSW